MSYIRTVSIWIGTLLLTVLFNSIILGEFRNKWFWIPVGIGLAVVIPLGCVGIWFLCPWLH